MKKVLIVSELFYPSNKIGALRPTKIAKMLLERNTAVDVLTAEPVPHAFAAEHFRSFAVRESARAAAPGSGCAPVKPAGKLVTELKRFKRTVLSYRMGRQYAQKALELFRNGTLHAEDYDACFTTFGPVSSVLIGLELKRKYHIKNWICDFRDPMVVKMISVFMMPFYKWLQNRACKHADKIVAVSNGYVRRICGKRYPDKTYMIPNGYDPADLCDAAVSEHGDTMTLAYVGALYEGQRDLSPVFRALSELQKKQQIDCAKIKFVYAGGEYAALAAQAQRYAMEHVLEDCGKLSRADCLRLQRRADILVLSTWNDRGEEGVFPGKFLEYMLIGRPIISITSGKLPDSEVTSVMREGQFGVAYESARDKQDYRLLKDYIKQAYDAFQQEGKIPFAPVNAVLERYSYASIIQRIEGLL